MDYIKNSLSFLRAKISRKKHLKCVKNILINKDEYAWIKGRNKKTRSKKAQKNKKEKEA